MISNPYVSLWKVSTEEMMGDLPGDPVVKNLPFNAGNASLILCQGTKIPHAEGQLSPGTKTREDHAP